MNGRDGPELWVLRLAWLLVGLGLAGILWGVFYMNLHALGGSPRGNDFAHRRSYDQVKGAVHEAFPGFVLRAGGGLVLLIVGARLRPRARR